MDRRAEIRARLLGDDRHTLMDASAMRRAGRELYGNPEQLSFYGLGPLDLAAKGCRFAGRTAIEGKFDQAAGFFAERLQSVLDLHYPELVGSAILDLFLGSGNMLYHLASAVAAERALGFETDDAVFRLTRHNFQSIGFAADIHPRGFGPRDAERIPSEQLVVVTMDPPWAGGFSYDTGLDLRRTEPPVLETARNVVKALAGHAAVVLMVFTPDRLDPESLEELLDVFPLLERCVTDWWGPGSDLGCLFCRGA